LIITVTPTLAMATLLDVFQNRKLVDVEQLCTAWPAFQPVAGNQLTFCPGNVYFHVQIILIVLLQIAVANVLAVVTWYGVVLPKRRDGNNHLAWLVGFGIVIPCALFLPFFIINKLDIRSTPLRFGLLLLPMIIPLKCLDALFGIYDATRRIRM
jgi:hypothetical protein